MRESQHRFKCRIPCWKTSAPGGGKNNDNPVSSLPIFQNKSILENK